MLTDEPGRPREGVVSAEDNDVQLGLELRSALLLGLKPRSGLLLSLDSANSSVDLLTALSFFPPIPTAIVSSECLEAVVEGMLLLCS